MALRISRSRAVFSSLALRSASSASLDSRSALSIFSLSTLRRFKSASFLVRGPKSADLKKCSEQIKFGFASFVVDRRGRILASVLSNHFYIGERRVAAMTFECREDGPHANPTHIRQVLDGDG